MVNSSDVPSVRVLPDGTPLRHWMEDSVARSGSLQPELAWVADGPHCSRRLFATHRYKTVLAHVLPRCFPIADGGLGLVCGRPRAQRDELYDASSRVYVPQEPKQLSEHTAKSTSRGCRVFGPDDRRPFPPTVLMPLYRKIAAPGDSLPLVTRLASRWTCR